VNCATRGERTLDLLFCNVKTAYKVMKRSPLGISDHNMLYCMPMYKHKLKKMDCKTIQIREWSDLSIDSLKACFDWTDWSVLYDENCELDYNVDVCSCYINFCTDLVVPSKVVKIYANNKPWITKDVKELINKKKWALSCDRSALKAIQKELNSKINDAKGIYKRKIEDLFKSQQSKDAWKGLKFISGYVNKTFVFDPDDIDSYVKELNHFYARFDDVNFQPLCDMMLNDIDFSLYEKIIMSEEDVVLALGMAKPGKASGPDKVLSRVVKNCKYELMSPMRRIFQSSLDQCVIPAGWKTSEIIPVPKGRTPRVMNDLRPVALTSVLMKCLESFVKKCLCKQVEHLCDKLQFAYQQNRSVDDAVVTLVNSICCHLEKLKSYSRVLFVDFSSAFNTIKPHIMLRKLQDMNVNGYLIKWVTNYLTGRPQYVKLNGVISEKVITNTGAPQGCVLSPLLFTLYTNDCVSSQDNCTLLKYADDTVILGNILNNDTTMYRRQIDEFVEWCRSNFLNLNVQKTMEMIIDFRKESDQHVSVTIQGEDVKIVNSYKYLGVYIDDRMNFSENVHNLYIKCLQRIRHVRELGKLWVDVNIMSLFYKSVVESVLSYTRSIVTWYGLSAKTDQRKLCKIIKVAQRLGICTKGLNELYNEYVLKLVKKILNDEGHPLHNEFVYLKSGRRLSTPRQRSNRYGKSFVPAGVRLFNHMCCK
jgi:gmma-aminobutyric acid receptor subunit gamma/cGMP-dependent protein kinase 2